MADTPIQVTGTLTIDGAEPVVIIGPNGAGKTRLASALGRKGGFDMVPALRSIGLGPGIPKRSTQEADRQLRKSIDRGKKQPWQMANEINELFSKLMAENSESAVRYRDEAMRAQASGEEGPSEIPITTMMRLRDVWHHLFPGRELDFSDYSPIVTNTTQHGSHQYPAQQMSDGERVALYLAGRVLDTEASVLIVDEPEVHFHSRLATRFWTAMQEIRPDLRFVYVTHDLPFALSRVDARFLLVLPGEDPQELRIDKGAPDELTGPLLAAASFSIHARRVVFCEGTDESSLDRMLYEAWFPLRTTAVVPVGDSETVTKSSQTFASTELVAGVEAIGIIDRDFWPHSYIESLDDSIHVLRVHEVENLFCLRGIFVAVARAIGLSDAEAADAYDAAIEQARERVRHQLLANTISERTRRRCEHEFRSAMNRAGKVEDGAALAGALDPALWSAPPADIYEQEQRRLNEALDEGSDEDFHRFFPGKAILSVFAMALGVEKDRYCHIVLKVLGAGRMDGSGADPDAVAALAEHLPRRETFIDEQTHG